MARSEGILPALESSHAVAEAMEIGRRAEARGGDGRLPLRPRRQGRRRDRPAAGPQAIAEDVALTPNVRHRLPLRRRSFAADGRKALMPFVTAGDPDLDFTAELLRRLVARGAALCELGIPYSDPIADGPVIQASYTRALEQRSSWPRSWPCSAGLTPQLPAPLVTMVSYAIIYRHGLERYVADGQGGGRGRGDRARPARRGGRPAGRGLPPRGLQPDPADHADDAARPGPAHRRRTTGFIYYVSVTGITGERTSLPPELRRQRGLAARADAAADLHRLRHQPAGARADARPRWPTG